MSHLIKYKQINRWKAKGKKEKKLADGSSIAIPCVFSADATGADIGIVVVVDNRGGEVVLGVVGCEDISSSYYKKENIDLSKFISINKVKYEHTCKLDFKKKIILIGHGWMIKSTVFSHLMTLVDTHISIKKLSYSDLRFLWVFFCSLLSRDNEREIRIKKKLDHIWWRAWDNCY
jgi:hypothetical protein